MTQVVVVDAMRPDASAIEHAAAVLRSGGLVAFPTETVYGLGAHALDRAAVRRLFDAKGRPSSDPLIVHVCSLDDARALVGEVPAAAARLAARFWPGPLTLVLPRSAAVPDEVTAGRQTVAIRAPVHTVAQALLAAARVPVAAPSANLFSRPSPTRAAHVMDDLAGRIDLILDAGPSPVGVESTVVDLTGDVPRVLRPGAITLSMLREVLGRVDSGEPLAGVAPGEGLPSPGLLEKHYAPRAPLTLYAGDEQRSLARMADDARRLQAQGQRVGLLVASEDASALADPPGLHVVTAGSCRDLALVAARLYDALRELDAAGVDAILARDFPHDLDLGDAIHDRLRRAAAGRIVAS